MSKIQVIYWSGTGNTEMMANAIAKGINAAGEEADVKSVTAASAAACKDDPVLVLGCPSMGIEVLEEVDMEPFMCDLDSCIKGKKVALFGSYGWGDGEWMRNWVDRCVSDGATIIGGEGLILNETPDADGLAQCEAFGKTIATA